MAMLGSLFALVKVSECECALPAARSQDGFGVFVYLLRGLKILFVSPFVLILAFFGRVVTTNLRTRKVNPAAIIILKASD